MARQDIITLRKAAAIRSPLALLSARVRGIFNTIALNFRLLWSGGGFSKKYIEQINQIAAEQYRHLDALPSAPPGGSALSAQRKPGFVSQSPKAPAQWI